MEEKLRDKLFNKKEIGWKEIDERQKEEIFNFCNGYLKFLNKAKIEREFVVEAQKVAEANGFKDINTFDKLKTGDKVYFINSIHNFLICNRSINYCFTDFL